MARALITGVADGGVYALFALGIVLSYRASRVLNLAHGEIGAFSVLVAASLLHAFWPFGPLVAMGVGAAIAVTFERTVVARMEDAPRSSVTVATIGLILLFLGIEIKEPSLLKPIPAAFSGPGPTILGAYPGPTRIIALGAVVPCSIALAQFIRRTDFGLATVAASRDGIAARMVGLPVRAASMLSWGAAGALAALSMSLLAPSFAILVPGTGTFLLVRGVAAAVIGGLSRPYGALAGGIVVGLVESITGHFLVTSHVRGVSTVAVLAVVVLVLLARPGRLAEP